MKIRMALFPGSSAQCSFALRGLCSMRNGTLGFSHHCGNVSFCPERTGRSPLPALLLAHCVACVRHKAPSTSSGAVELTGTHCEIKLQGLRQRPGEETRGMGTSSQPAEWLVHGANHTQVQVRWRLPPAAGFKCMVIYLQAQTSQHGCCLVVF